MVNLEQGDQPTYACYPRAPRNNSWRGSSLGTLNCFGKAIEGKNRPPSSYYEDFFFKGNRKLKHPLLTSSEHFISPWHSKENARRAHRQKEFSELIPVVWQEVQINSFVGSIGYSLGIHQQYVIHFIWNTCVRVARELSSLLAWLLELNPAGSTAWFGSDRRIVTWVVMGLVAFPLPPKAAWRLCQKESEGGSDWGDQCLYSQCFFHHLSSSCQFCFSNNKFSLLYQALIYEGFLDSPC